jgi:hypothetical protein
MGDEPRAAEPVEDLDIPADEREGVKGGFAESEHAEIQDGTSNTVTYGQRFKKPSVGKLAPDP